MNRRSELSRRTALDRGPGPKRKAAPRRSAKRQRTDAEVAAMAAFRALAERKDARCAVCGHGRTRRERNELEVHHCVDRQELERRGLDPWDPDWGVVLCREPAPNRCHARHTLAVRRVPLSALRPENFEIAERHGLGWYLSKRYEGGNDGQDDHRR